MNLRRLLFLCTGNYYRSRFAEEYWNDRAERAALGWWADSRGLADPPSVGNAGTMSADAVAELTRLVVRVRGADRPPRAVRGEEFALFARVIALDGDEHRPMLACAHPAEVERVEYWDIGDVWKERPADAMRRLVMRLERLLDELRGGSSPSGDGRRQRLQ